MTKEEVNKSLQDAAKLDGQDFEGIYDSIVKIKRLLREVKNKDYIIKHKLFDTFANKSFLLIVRSRECITKVEEVESYMEFIRSLTKEKQEELIKTINKVTRLLRGD